MPSNDSGLLYEMLGAPMLALVQGEFQAAQVSAEIIERLGFVDLDDNADSSTSPGSAVGDQSLGRLRLTSFRQQKRTPAGDPYELDVQIPTLSLFPMPMIQMKETEFNFNLNVTQVERTLPRLTLTSPLTRRVNLTQRLQRTAEFLSPQRLQLKTSMGRSSASRVRRTERPMSVRMVLEPSDFPNGLERLYQIMDDSVQGVEVRDQEDDASTPATPVA